MSRHSKRQRLRGLVREIGEPPSCLGWYLAGDEECEGPPPCGWRSGCRIYREFSQARGVDPEVEKRLISKSTLSNLVFNLMHEWAPSAGSDSIRASRAWDRFLEAFTDAIPVAVHPNESVSLIGDLYVQTWDNPRKPGMFRTKLIRVKPERKGDRWSIPIVRYWPIFSSKVRPTIEIRTDLKRLIEREERVRNLAERWRVSGPGSSSLGAAAVKVFPERIPDLARLVAKLLREGEIRGVSIKGGQIKEGEIDE